MSVSNGQLANATTFNNAFMSRNSNTSTVGQVDLTNADAASGSSVTNAQRELNSLASFLGKLTNIAKDALPAFTTNDGDDMFERLDQVSETVFAEPETLLKNVRVEADDGTIVDLDSSSPVVIMPGAVTNFIEGIDGGTNGKIIFLVNSNGTDGFGLVHNAAGAAAGDKLRLQSEEDIGVPAFGGAVLVYYNSYWHCVATVGGGGGGAGTGYFNVTVNEYALAPTPVYSNDYKEWEIEEQSGQGIVLTFTVPDDLGPVDLEAKFLVSSPTTGNVVFNTRTQVYVQLNASRGVPLVSDNEDTTVAIGTIDEYTLVTLPITQNLNDSPGNEDVVGGRTLVVRITRPVSGSDTIADVVYLVEGSIRVVEVA